MRWHWLAIAGVVPSALMVILMIHFPETPRWLIKNGRISEAREVLVFLRKTSYEKCEDECREIQQTLGLFYSLIFLSDIIFEKITIVNITKNMAACTFGQNALES